MTITFDPPTDTILADKHARVSISFPFDSPSVYFYARPVGVSILTAGGLAAQASGCLGTDDPGAETVYDLYTGLYGSGYSKGRAFVESDPATFLVKRDLGWWNHKTGPFGSNSLGARMEIGFVEEAADLYAHYTYRSAPATSWPSLTESATIEGALEDAPEPPVTIAEDTAVWVTTPWTGTDVLVTSGPFTFIWDGAISGDGVILEQVQDSEPDLTDRVSLSVEDGVLYFRYSEGEASFPVPNAEFHSWGAVFTGTVMQLWLDGGLVASDTYTPGAVSYSEFAMGGASGIWVRTLKSWSRVLDSSEIRGRGNTLVASATYTVPA